MRFPIIGKTNLIIYPRAILLPADEYLEDGSKNADYLGEPTDQNSFIYGVDHDGRTVFVRLDYRISRTTVTPDGELEVTIGDSMRDSTANGNGRVLPSVAFLADITKTNYWCAADMDNDASKNRMYSVILISKINPLKGEPLLSAVATFKKSHQAFADENNISIGDAKFIDCGYFKVLNHGVDKRPAMVEFKKKQIGTAASPLFGIGRLELRVTKPSKTTLAYSLLNNREHGLKGTNEAMRVIDTYMSSKMRYNNLKKRKREAAQRGESTDDISQEMNDLKGRIDTLPSIGRIRSYSSALAAYASWGETMSRASELRKRYLANKGADPINDQALISQISDLSLHCDKLAIENGFANFRTVLFYPDAIVRAKFDREYLCFFINKFFVEYTGSGSYGGVYLRVLDKNGLVIPQLGYYFECRWMGEGKTTSAVDAYTYFASNSDSFKEITKYISKGLYFELVPFKVTGASKKDATDHLAKYWLGDSRSTGMRDLFYDPIHDEGINTFIAISRRKTRAQADSEFLASVAPTGIKNGVPNELSITSDINVSRKIRKRG